MDQYLFRVRLLRVSNGITNRELRQLKYVCKAHIADGFLEEIDRPEKLFVELEKRKLLSPENTELLENLLSEIHRLDLKEELLGETLQETEQQLNSLQKQLREKDEQVESLIQQLKLTEEQNDLNLQTVQNELKRVKQELENKRQEQEKDEHEADSESRQLTIRDISKQQDQIDLDMDQLRAKVTNQERKSRDGEQDLDVVELKTALSAAKQQLHEYESQLKKHDWVISRDDIKVTDKYIGRGGAGCVVEGRYCDFSVAVKLICTTKLLLNPQERSLYEQEMDIASQCRHPCLLQFIGATNDDKSPLVVSELMESNLRTLLGQRLLSEAEVRVLSLDVARALNYLHQKQPAPIVHGNVSSSNVLLQWHHGYWRAKLSDYCTAKFVRDIMAVVPGTMIYNAPQVGSSCNQTVKIVFFVKCASGNYQTLTGMMSK